MFDSPRASAVAQFTVRLTDATAVVEVVVLLGETPFWSTPLRVKV
jgi:hypothetical protein